MAKSTMLVIAALCSIVAGNAVSNEIGKGDFSPPPSEQQLPFEMHSQMDHRPSISVGYDNADLVGRDNKALQAAVDYIAALGGGTVTIGPGEYLMRDSLHLRSHVTVRGTEDKTILRKADAAVSPLALDGNFGEQQITVKDSTGFDVGYGVAIWDKFSRGFHMTVARITGRTENTFSIDRPCMADHMIARDATAATVFPVISGHDIRGARIESVVVEGNKQANHHMNGCRGAGIYLYRGYGTIIQNCTVRNFSGDGISFQQSNDVVVDRCISEGNTIRDTRAESAQTQTVGVVVDEQVRTITLKDNRILAQKQLEDRRPQDSPDDVSRVLERGKLPDDERLGEPRELGDNYHPWEPPKTKHAWEKQAKAIRQRILVSNGLWPMPPKAPLKPVVHGKIDRGDYTIEKVFFASHPGHFVTGNLYRPKNVNGKIPGVLCPHGHWPHGRFTDAGEDKAKRQIEKGAEQYLSGARYVLQARMAKLARLGCIVFHYDMVGYADSQQTDHLRQGLTDVEAGLRLQNSMGLQTFNTICALDFLMSQSEVDPQRIGVTGASGGGTQTFVLCAIDPRPSVAFPAVMVSTNMQGGCTCENAAYLRIGLNNIALAALFAPKPMALSGADDWTIDIETEGFPELRRVYSLYSKRHFVHAKAYPQFKHNYNQVAREMMYNWFNEHLKLGHKSPIVEQDFESVPPEQLSVFDDDHRLPNDAKSLAKLRDYFTSVAEKQFKDLLPGGIDDLAEYRKVVGGAAHVMLDRGVPESDQLESQEVAKSQIGDVVLQKYIMGRKGTHEAIPFIVLTPPHFSGKYLLWIDGRGKSHLFDGTGELNPSVQKLLSAGMAVASADVFLTGEFIDGNTEVKHVPVNEKYQGFTFGYNRPLISNRVRDILTAVGYLAQDKRTKSIQLVGTGDAGPWVLLATGLAGSHAAGALVDVGNFRFENVTSVTDPNFLPGALKYGDLAGLAALAAPTPLIIAGQIDTVPDADDPLQRIYRVSGGTLTHEKIRLVPADVADKLLLKNDL